MPSNPFYSKCYFGCDVEGTLHHFPKPVHPYVERFEAWKNVLDAETQKKKAQYIYDQLRLCNKHFEPCYLLPSGRLTRNAIPTINIGCRKLQHLPLLDNYSVLEHSTEDMVSTNILSVNHDQPLLQNEELMNMIQDLPNSSMQIENLSPVVVEEPQLQEFTPQAIVPQSRTSRTQQSSTKSQMQIKRLRLKLKKLSNKYKTQSKKILCAQKISNSQIFLKTIENLPEPIKIFGGLQIKLKKKPRGRRYTADEKVLALSIYKQSPKAYKVLKNLFVLPSKRTLQKILSLIHLETGVNTHLMEKLKNDAKKLPKDKRLCNLLFDEVALAPSLNFNQEKINGFEDFGYKVTKKIADHALVCMIKSIKGKFKQPLSFTFCQSCTKKEDLKKIIVELIKEINKTGLKIVATICDQSQSNISVINSLQKETRVNYLKQGKDYYSKAIEIENIKFFPLFDTPHLLKGVRNNLLKKDAVFTLNGSTKTAKWEHLKMLLKEDIGQDEIRLVNKITEMHIDENKIPKMKVKYAAQVFSQRVSSAMRFLARHGILPEECSETAEFLLMFDKLFDSFNGHSYSDSAKEYKGCLKNNSPHIKFWKEVLPTLKSIKFKTIKKNRDGTETIKYETVPSVMNWAENIETTIEMWEYLRKENNISNVIMRNFNQDPLENFFCGIRSNGVRNVNPTCDQFIKAYKTLLVNNLSSPHSVSANCEKDDNKSLQSLKSLIDHKNICTPQETGLEVFSIDSLIRNMASNSDAECNIIHKESKRYVAGYIIQKCQKKIFKHCETCKKDFLSDERDPATYTYYRDYTKKSLTYTKEEIILLLNSIYDVIMLCLRESPEEKNLKAKILQFIEINTDFNLVSCEVHKNLLTKLITNTAINIIVHTWCKGVNNILKGKISNFDARDEIKAQARVYFEKRNKNK